MESLKSVNDQDVQNELKPIELKQAKAFLSNIGDEENQKLKNQSEDEYKKEQEQIIEDTKQVIEDTREETKNLLKKAKINIDIAYTNKNINSTYKDIIIQEMPKDITTNMNNYTYKKESTNLKIMEEQKIQIENKINNLSWPHDSRSLKDILHLVDKLVSIGDNETAQWFIDKIKETYKEDIYTQRKEYNGLIVKTKEEEIRIDKLLTNIENPNEMVGNNAFSNNIINIFKTSEKPFEDIKKLLEDSSEDEKIEAARLFASLLAKNYDNNMFENKSKGDVSNQEMLNSLKSYLKTGEIMSAGVCRHIHAITAGLLSKIGINSALITTNSGGRHAICFGKKNNGEFFIIDYGQVYYGKDIKELKAKYLSQYGSIDLKERISTPDGKIIGNIETFLETKLREISSINGIPNMLDRSSQIAKEGIIHQEGHNINVKSSSKNDININYNYGTKDFKSGNFEIEGSMNKTTSVEGNLTSGTIGGKLNLKDTKLGDLSVGGAYGKHKVVYNTGNNSDINTVNLVADQYKNLYNKNGDKLNLGTSFEGTFLQKTNQSVVNQDNEMIKNKTNEWIDGTTEIGTNLYGIKDLGQLDIEGNAGVKYDIDLNNLRTANTIKGYLGYQAGSKINYTTDNGTKIGLGGQYQHVLGSNNIKGEFDVMTNKGTTLFGNIEKTTYTHDFGNETIKANLGIQQNFGDNVMAYISGNLEKRDSGFSDKQITAGVKINF